MAHPTVEGFFSARDGIRLYWQTARPEHPENAPAHIAFVHGYAEHLGRHKFVTEALCKAGYVVHLLDVRGHGQSGGKRAFVEKFDHYLSDLDLFLERVRDAAKGKPVFLAGHSNGGLIVARYLLDKPDVVKGAFLSSPYLRLKLAVPAIKILAGKLFSNLLPSLPMKNELKPEQLTRDPIVQEETRKDPQYQQIATPRWFTEASAAQETVLRRASEFVTPLLVMVGSDDPIADPKAGREFFEGATAKDKSFKEYTGYLHELFNEPPREREQVFADLIGWLDARAQKSGGAAVAAPPAADAGSGARA